MWIDACGNGSQTRAIFTRHPKRQLHEGHYARCVVALEDKIVQRAVAALLNAIYEEDFLGFSYGFRPGRGQKARITWERITLLVDAWLPKPLILHPWPSERFAVTHPRWEPYAGKPHVRICAGGVR